MKKSVYKTVIWLTAVLVTLFVLTNRGWIGSLVHPLPFDGPKSGKVVDAERGRPVAGARITAIWGCWDFPYPHIAEYFVYSHTISDRNSHYEIKKPERRGGWFGGSFSLDIQAGGYIPAGFYQRLGKAGDDGTKTQAYPFMTVAAFSRFPETLDISLIPAKSVLLKELGSDNPDYRSIAARMLGEIGPEAVYAVGPLSKALRDKNAKVRAGAAGALGKIGIGARDTVSELLKLFNDRDENVRIAAIKSTGEIGCTDNNAATELTKLLNDKNRIIRKKAVRSLGDCGSRAKTAVAALRNMLKRKWISRYMRSEIEYALQKIEADASN